MRRLALVVAAALGAPTWAQQPPAPAKPVGTIAAPGGRYAFGQVSEFRRDQYLLDTQTGRMWLIVCYPFDKAKPAEGENCAKVLEPVLFAPAGGSNKPLTPTPQ